MKLQKRKKGGVGTNGGSLEKATRMMGNLYCLRGERVKGNGENDRRGFGKVDSKTWTATRRQRKRKKGNVGRGLEKEERSKPFRKSLKRTGCKTRGKEGERRGRKEKTESIIQGKEGKEGARKRNKEICYVKKGKD